MTGNEAPDPKYARKVEGGVLDIPSARLYGSCFGAPVLGEAEPVQTCGEELDGGGSSFQEGVIRALSAFAGGSASAKLLPSGPFGATVEIVAPARGDRLVACGRSVRSGRDKPVAAGEVLAVEGGEESLRTTVPVAVRDIERAGVGR